MIIAAQAPPTNLVSLRPVAAPGGFTAHSRADGFMPSAELSDPAAFNPADATLHGQAQQLLLAAAFGVGDVRALGEQLLEDYTRARESGAVLTPQTEALVQEALQLAGLGNALQPGTAAPHGVGAEPSGAGPTSSLAPTSTTGASPSGVSADGPSGAQDSPNSTTGWTPATEEAGAEASPASQSSDALATTEGALAATEGASATTETSVVDDAELAPAQEVAEVFDDFAQGEPANCAATAVIKQMQQQWGDQAMTFEPQADGALSVTMRDGYTTRLTPEQIRQAGLASDYTGDDPTVREQAIRMNAAAAARYAEENGVSYEEALTAINQPNHVDLVDGYFGVQTESVDPMTLDGNGQAIVSNGTHAAVVMRTENGDLHQDDHGYLAQDASGNPQAYDGTIISNGQDTGPATSAWILTDVGASPTPASSKVKSVSLDKLERQGYLNRLSRPAIDKLRTAPPATENTASSAPTRTTATEPRASSPQAAPPATKKPASSAPTRTSVTKPKASSTEAKAA